MPPLLLIVLVVWLVVAWPTEKEHMPPQVGLASPCAGESRPVDEETLVRILARYGIDLEREDACVGAVHEPAAMFTNITVAGFDKPEADVIFASQGQVWCALYAEARFGATVTRRRVDDEVILRVLNVDCTIYESDAWQIERLDDAVRQLSKEV